MREYEDVRGNEDVPGITTLLTSLLTMRTSHPHLRSFLLTSQFPDRAHFLSIFLVSVDHIWMFIVGISMV